MNILSRFSKPHLSLWSCHLILSTSFIYIIVLDFNLQVTILYLVSYFLFLRLRCIYSCHLILFSASLLRRQSIHYFLWRYSFLRRYFCGSSTNYDIKIVFLGRQSTLKKLRLICICLVFFIFLSMSILLVIPCNH